MGKPEKLFPAEVVVGFYERLQQAVGAGGSCPYGSRWYQNQLSER